MSHGKTFTVQILAGRPLRFAGRKYDPVGADGRFGAFALCRVGPIDNSGSATLHPSVERADSAAGGKHGSGKTGPDGGQRYIGHAR